MITVPRAVTLAMCSMLIATVLPASAAGGERDDDWPQFRGPRATGVAAGDAPPAHWDTESGESIAWSVEIPGLGHASPIVSGDFVFVVTAVSDDGNAELRVGRYGDIAPVENESPQTWQLLCLSRRTGQIFWTRDLCHGLPEIKRHTKASHANSTPAADGRHVVAFLGSEGLYCYDYLGNRLWERDFGTLDSGYYVVPEAQWGFASSPILHRGRVIVQCDVQDDSFLAALDVETGRELWRTERSDVPTWATPTVYRDGGRDLLAVNGYRHSGGYDFLSGDEVWRVEGGGDIPVPTPVVADDLIVFSSAHGPARPLRAIRTSARGTLDVPETRGGEPQPPEAAESIAWWREKDGIYMPTPICVDGLLYACSGSGVLSCYDVTSGERLYRERLGTGGLGFTASPVSAGDRIYFPAEDGSVYVVRAGREFEQLAKNAMNDICMATPAIAHGVLYVRTRARLYAVGPPPAPAPPLGRPCRIRRCP